MGGQAQLAEAVGVTPQNLNDVLNGRRPPGPTLLKAIGVKKSKVYELED
jgi:transcriptional regulator with XRE-family HTH domain